ncbi:MAG: hypothetical protein J4G05_07940 [Chlorobi bacterium]|nr:hypothetical protein [Chlorobiota bacterium]
MAVTRTLNVTSSCSRNHHITRGDGEVMGTSTHKFSVYGYTIAEGIFNITE